MDPSHHQAELGVGILGELDILEGDLDAIGDQGREIEDAHLARGQELVRDELLIGDGHRADGELRLCRRPLADEVPVLRAVDDDGAILEIHDVEPAGEEGGLGEVERGA